MLQSSATGEPSPPSDRWSRCCHACPLKNSYLFGLAATVSELDGRLLEAGRAKEAWSAINAVNESRPGWIPFEWEEIRLNVMEALGNKDEAQVFRWQCFERTLNSAPSARLSQEIA